MITSKRKKKCTFILFGAFFLFSGMEYSLILPTLWTYLRVTFQAEMYFFGLALSAFPIAGMIFGLIIGWISDITTNTFILLLICNSIQISGSILYAFAPSAWLLVCGRFVSGMGNGVGAALFGDIAKTTVNTNMTSIFGKLFAIRQFGLMIGPCCNLIFFKVSFFIDQYQINAYNSPGLFIALFWVLHNLMALFLFYDLKEIRKQELLENLYHENSSIDRTSQNYGAFNNTINNQSDSFIANNKDNIEENYHKILVNNDNNIDDCVANNEDSISISSDTYLNIAEKYLSNELLDIHSFYVSTPSIKRRYSEGNILNMYDLNEQKNNDNNLKTVSFHKNQKSKSFDDIVQAMKSYIRNNNSDLIVNDSNYINDFYDDNQNINNDNEILITPAIDFKLSNNIENGNYNRTNYYYNFYIYLKPEIISILATFFMGAFNQAALETLLPLLSQQLLNWSEFEISVIFFCSAIEIISVALLLKPLNKILANRSLIVIGTILQLICVCIMLFFLPNSFLCSFSIKVFILLSLVFIDLIGLPFQLIASTSLYSTLTPQSTQGFGQGIRRIFVNLGLILGPLWASSLLPRPFILFPTMIGINLISLILIIASFRSLKSHDSE